MNKLLLFFSVLTIFACNGIQKNNTTSISDTLEAKDKGNVKAIPRDTVKVNQTNINQPEGKDPDQIHDDFIQKAIVYRSDSSLNMFENIRADYKIFGYQAADTNSRKLLLVSVFTKDVEGNPYNCEYGSYYGSNVMEGIRIKYVKSTGNFVEANLIKDKVVLTPIFIQKNWVEFKD